jgi:branched-chain amino acid transport system permease protein
MSVLTASAPVATTSRERMARAVPILVILAVLVVVPFVLSDFRLDQATGWIPLAVGALGLNLLTGYNGQISIGHGALYGVGAYSAGLLVTNWHWPLLLSMVGGALIAFVAGVVIGLPALRIKGLYLALVTLAVAILFPDLVRGLDSITGGSSGLQITNNVINSRGVEVQRSVFWAPPSWTGLSSTQWTFYVYLAVAVVSFVLVRNLVKSRTGRAMVAVRDNEVAAEVNGVNVARVKVITFGLSSGLAGVGGALFALKEGQVFPQTFIITASFYFLVAVVVGGAASVTGPALGALVYGIFFDVVRPELPERWVGATPLILAVFLIGFMYLAPGGLVGLIRRGGARLGFGPRPTPAGTFSTEASPTTGDQTAPLERTEDGAVHPQGARADEGSVRPDTAGEPASGGAAPGMDAGEPLDD